MPSANLDEIIPSESLVEAVTHELLGRDEILKQLKYNLTRAQQRMSKYANAKRSDISFETGEFVFVKLRPIANRQSLGELIQNCYRATMGLLRFFIRLMKQLICWSFQ